MTETHVVDLRPPIEIVYIGNGCEGYSPHLYIPARSTLTSEINIREWGDYFLQFNDKYSKEENVGIWLKLKFRLQDKEKVRREVKTWAELQPMTYDFLNQKIDMFDDNYPLEILTKPLLVLLIIVTIIIIAVLIAMAIEWWKNRKGIKEIKEWAKFAMEELVKLKPSHDTGNPLTRNRREPPEPTDLIYETPPYICCKVTAQIEEPLIIPETAVNLTNKPLANTASTSSLNLLTTPDETSLEYGLLKVSKVKGCIASSGEGSTHCRQVLQIHSKKEHYQRHRVMAENVVKDITSNKTLQPIKLQWGPGDNQNTFLYYQRLSQYAIPPKQATPGSIRLDLYVPVEFSIPPGEQTRIPTDLILVPSDGYYIRIASKSGLVVKHQITVEAGEIDPDYRGNIVVVLRNHHKKKGYIVKVGEAIAQVIITKVTIPELLETPIAVDTIRGIGGFGLTHTLK